MTTFTIYFCGTGSNRFDSSNSNYCNGELVSTLMANNLGREFSEWICIDGPGSGNLSEDELWIEGGKHYSWAGNLFGWGWEENVKHAINIMKGNVEWQRKKLSKEQYNLLKSSGIPVQDVEITGAFLWRIFDYGDRKITQQQLQKKIIEIYRKDGIVPTSVNLVGWSRGGISCHMLANAMFKDEVLKKIPVNIFSIDPVPGPLNFQSEKTHLKSNVREYVAFYAADERSKGFTCVIPETDKSTAVHLYPMSGRHATLAGNASSDGVSSGKELYEPGMIVRHFAEVCLKRWGVNQQKTLNLCDEKLAELHSQIEINENLYKKMQNNSYTIITESNNGERNVFYKNRTTNFSSVKNDEIVPNSGLTSFFLKDKSIYEAIK